MIKKLFFAAVMALVVSSCLSAENVSIKGKEYKLTYAPYGADITLGFSPTGNNYSGSVVNNYFGVYTISGNNIKFSQAGATRMMGPRDLMKAEAEYLPLLSLVTTYKARGKKLVLYLNNGDELVFKQVESKN